MVCGIFSCMVLRISGPHAAQGVRGRSCMYVRWSLPPSTQVVWLAPNLNQTASEGTVCT